MKHFFFRFFFIALYINISTPISYSEAIFDGTINPENANQTLSGTFTIKPGDGKQKGNNLFHSFKKFDLKQNEVALFTGENINNIISRVTGGTASIIDGTIKSDIDGANLFFINPFGIIFNEHAKINIKGSFHAITANYINLENGEKFHVDNDNPVLFCSDPKQFGFINQSNSMIELNKVEWNIDNNKILSFIGNEINICNSKLSFPKSRLNIASVKANNSDINITLAEYGFDVSEGTKLGNINISDSDINLDIGGKGSGDLYILGGNININCCIIKSRPADLYSGVIEIIADNFLMENSSITTSTGSKTTSSNTNIFSKNNVHLLHSYISSNTFGEGNAGNILIDSKNIILENGTELFTATITTGNGGNISLKADNSIILNGCEDNVNSLVTFTYDNGNAGNILISANNISIRDGAAIVANTYNKGNAGDITIQAIGGSIEIAGYSSLDDNKKFGFSTNISSKQECFISDSGKSGDITIYSDNLIIKDGAKITNSTECDGESGTIEIKTNSINISGYAVDKNEINQTLQTHFSGIYSRSSYQNYCDKPGGQITISSNTVNLRNHGVISTSTTGQRNAGDLQLTVDKLLLENQSSLTSESSKTLNGGAAGKITINASDTIQLKNKSSLSTQATNISKENSIDNSGKISIKSNEYIYLSNSKITTSVKGGTGNGGDIEIVPKMMVLNKSNIVANAYEGNGGNIYIFAEHFVQSVDSTIEASSEKGIDGSVDIQVIESTEKHNFTPLSNNYLNAEPLLKDPCDKRTGKNISRFMLVKPEGLSPFFDDFLHVPIMMVMQPFETNHQPVLNAITDKTFQNFEKGFVKENIILWNQLLQSDELDQINTIQLKIFLSCAYKHIGYYKKALSILSEIQHDVDRSDSLYVQSLFYNCLGDIHLLNNSILDARECFDKAFDKASLINNKIIQAVARNNYANALAVHGKLYDAVSYYQEAVAVAKSIKHPNASYIKAISYINIAHLYSIKKDFNNAISNLTDSLSEINTLKNNYQKASCFISFCAAADNIISEYQDANLFNMAMKALHCARAIVKIFHNNYLLSYIYGYMGKLNENIANYPMAIQYTKKAINISAYNNFPESLYLWQWQQGRLLFVKNDIDSSIEMHKKAINTLMPIRSQIYQTSRNKKTNFQIKIKELYTSLIEKKIKQLDKESNQQVLLLEIRKTMDQLKQTQLENFYKDECIVRKNKDFENFDINADSAVIYPIILSDRLLILLIMDNGIKPFIVPYDDNLETIVKKFGKRLRDDHLDKRFELYAREIYDILIKPLEKDLIKNNIDTLVFSPDGILHILPFSALHDGKQFLIEKFAIAIIPSINLTDLDILTQFDKKILLAGLSEEANPPLPGVKKELTQIKTKIKEGKLLIDKSCTASNIEYELSYNDYSGIVFATHGQFSKSPEKTFLSIYKEKLTLDNLESLMNISRFRNQNIELLTLSACETAMGNEEIALGLAGIALKTGVKSVLATLWSVNDEVTYIVIKNFYSQLMKSISKISKAKAMQNVIKKLIAGNYRHPYYWCQYILIGNWY